MQSYHYFLISICFYAAGSAAASQHYIVGGAEAEPGSWPWQLALERWNADFWMYKCGASLIHPQYAITAAHCVDGSGTFRIRAGAHNLTAEDQEQTIIASNVIIHQEFSIFDPGLANDLAILELEEEVELSERVALVSLPPDDAGDYVGSECWAYGWGITNSSTELEYRVYPNDVLHEVQVKIITNQDCEDWWREITDFNQVYDVHICHGDYDVKEVGTCSGDSGGGLACQDDTLGDWVVAGVVSWGATKCEWAPSVNVRLSEYLDWIREHVPDV